MSGAPLVGQIFGGRYELVRLIARGGMGEVYEAQDGLLRRAVAVKVYRAEALADRSRFDAEVHTLAALNHPGLVQVFDAGEHEGDGFVVLELIDGPTLRAILADRGTLPPGEAAEVGTAMAAALASVHEAGVVHRDVTPSNILCGANGRPRLADFGIARLLDTTRVTALATTIGTAAYMAPEQVRGDDVTPAADVYSLGLVLLEALTGRPAFAGVGHEVALARLARDPDVETDVPADWQPVLRDMTTRQPEDRPTATEVADRLARLSTRPDTVAAGAPVAAASVGDEVDPEASTQAMALGGGTAVMPVPAMVGPDVVGPDAHHPGAAAPAAAVAWIATTWRENPLRMLAAAFVLVVLVAAVSAGDDGFDTPTPTSEPVSVTQPALTTTTAPPATVPPATAPPKDPKGDGHGKNDD